MLKGGSRGWSSDQLSVSSALSFWYLHPQPLAGPQASAPVGALPTAEGIPICTAPGYPRVSLLLLNIVPVAFAVASVDLISLSEGTLCSVLPLSQTLDRIFFPRHKPGSFHSVWRLRCSVWSFTESCSTRENGKYPHRVAKTSTNTASSGDARQGGSQCQLVS